MTLREIYVFHKDTDYFGKSEFMESRAYKPYFSKALKAVRKFFSRRYACDGDVMHIVTEDKHYVLAFAQLNGEWVLCWWYFYGPSNSKTEPVRCVEADVRQMLREQYTEEEQEW